MAHTKAGGSTNLGRDSQSKRLGVKRNAGELVQPGSIIIRQRGTKYHPGENTRLGNDDTIYATANGVVHFQSKLVKNFTGKLQQRKFVHVVA